MTGRKWGDLSPSERDDWWNELMARLSPGERKMMHDLLTEQREADAALVAHIERWCDVAPDWRENPACPNVWGD